MPATQTEVSMLMCRESFVGTFDDGNVYVGVKGKSIIDPSTPEGKRVLKAWAKFFEPIRETYPYRQPDQTISLVEQATAAPGEKRGAA